MFILILLLCASASSIVIPLIGGVDKSAVFNASLQKFEKHRLFVNIVDTVSYTAPPLTGQDCNCSSFSIGLTPSAKHANESDYPAYYDLVTRRVAELLGCTAVVFDGASGAPKYELQVKRGYFPISPNGSFINEAAESHPSSRFGADYLSDPGEALFASKFNEMIKRDLEGNEHLEGEEAARLVIHESPTMVRAGCMYSRSPGMMRLTFALGARPHIKSGWIVERHPVGLLFDKGNKTVHHATYLCVDYSYIDGTTGAVFDVVPRFDEATQTRLWTPTYHRAFEACGRMSDRWLKNERGSAFRETKTGVIVATQAQAMLLSYKIDGESFQESITLRGNYYFVNCTGKEKTSSSSTANERVRIAVGEGEYRRHYRCSPMPGRTVVAPEVLELEWSNAVHAVSRPIQSADRTLIKLRPDGTSEDVKTTQKPLNQDRAVAATTTVPANSNREHAVPTTERPNERRTVAATTGTPQNDSRQAAITTSSAQIVSRVFPTPSRGRRSIRFYQQ